MTLKEYFEEKKGVGVLATADGEGKVNAAVYARPHVMDDGSLAFIMRNRQTYYNLQSNPHAAYLFVEEGPGYEGKRLYLTKLGEDEDPDLVGSLERSWDSLEQSSVYKQEREISRILSFLSEHRQRWWQCQKCSTKQKYKLLKILSKKFKGKGNPFYGKTHTKKVREKISKTQKGRTRSDEQRLKHSRMAGGKRVSVYKKDTNEYIGTYFSASECARQLNLNVGHVCSCIRGNTKLKSHKGYIFKGINNEY